MLDEKSGFWVFGYGSLMWRPGFEFAERSVASIEGWRRSFCLWSVRYRGTDAAPGLVLGLDRDEAAQCQGVAYRVAASHAAETLAYLRERELVTYAYRETRAEAILSDGRTVETLIYVVDPAHAQYAGGLTLDAQCALIAERAGSMGPNRDYLHATVEHLAEIGVRDEELSALDAMVRAR